MISRTRRQRRKLQAEVSRLFWAGFELYSPHDFYLGRALGGPAHDKAVRRLRRACKPAWRHRLDHVPPAQ